MNRISRSEPVRPTANYVQCPECAMPVAMFRHRMISHVSQHHSVAPMYECGGCDAKFYSYGQSTRNIERHVDSRHNGNRQLIHDNRTRACIEITEQARTMFGDQFERARFNRRFV